MVPTHDLLVKRTRVWGLGVGWREGNGSGRWGKGVGELNGRENKGGFRIVSPRKLCWLTDRSDGGVCPGVGPWLGVLPRVPFWGRGPLTGGQGG